MDLKAHKRGFEANLALFGDQTGWALTPVIAWLVTEGRRVAEPTQLIDELCGRLVSAAAPLWRMRLYFQTLHPQVAACAFTWARKQGSTDLCVPHNIRDSDISIGSPIQQVYTTGRSVRHRLDRLDVEQNHPALQKLAVAGSTDYVVMPLVFSTGQINAFIIATDSPGGFSETDIAKFEALVNFLAPIFEVIMTRRITRTLLDTYVGHRTGSKILDGLIKRGDSETINAVLWFSDLRDFTRLTETLPPDRVLAMLNAYFEFVTTAVTTRGGEVLRFIGDAMLIIFPTERGSATKAACVAALDAALDAFNNRAALNQQRRRAGEPPIRFGVGLHVGEVIYGNVGAPDRLDFTVMGPAVNRTARLEGLTKKVGVPLLLSADLAAQVDRPVRSVGLHAMEGVAEPQEVFALADVPENATV